MALRNIRTGEEPCLRKICKEVPEMTDRTRQLIGDLLDTMYDAQGVGLAAPQVGILKRIAVVDIGEGPIVMINPVVVETAESQTGMEGCLSVPGKQGQVTRPAYAKVSCLNEDMKPVEIEGRDLLARAMLHEIDHLDGKLYLDILEGPLEDVETEED